MLPMQLQVNLCDPIRVGHVVIFRGACQAVCPAAIVLSPTDGCIDRDMGDMDPFGAELSRHTLRQA